MRARASAPTLLDVICLCAQWCGNCRDYAPVFEGMRERFAGAARLARACSH
jgi:thiol-disulfide isomerase/thioredoxin